MRHPDLALTFMIIRGSVRIFRWEISESSIAELETSAGTCARIMPGASVCVRVMWIRPVSLWNSFAIGAPRSIGLSVHRIPRITFALDSVLIIIPFVSQRGEEGRVDFHV